MCIAYILWYVIPSKCTPQPFSCPNPSYLRYCRHHPFSSGLEIFAKAFLRFHWLFSTKVDHRHKNSKKNSKILEVPKLYLVLYITFSTFLQINPKVQNIFTKTFGVYFEQVCLHFTSVVSHRGKCIRRKVVFYQQWLITMAWFPKEKQPSCQGYMKPTKPLPDFCNKTSMVWQSKLGYRRVERQICEKVQDFLAAMLNMLSFKPDPELFSKLKHSVWKSPKISYTWLFEFSNVAHLCSLVKWEFSCDIHTLWERTE